MKMVIMEEKSKTRLFRSSRTLPQDIEDITLLFYQIMGPGFRFDLIKAKPLTFSSPRGEVLKVRGKFMFRTAPGPGFQLKNRITRGIHSAKAE